MKLLRNGFVLVLVLFSASVLWSQSISEPTPQAPYDDLKLKYDSLNQTYQQLLLKSQNYETTLRSVLESSAKLTLLLTKAQLDSKTSQEDLQALTLSSKQLAIRLQIISDELASTKLQLKDYELKLGNLQTELADLNKKLQDSNNKLADISTRYNGLLKDYQDLTGRFQTLSEKYDILLTQFNELLVQVERLQVQLKAAYQIIDNLQKELAKVKKEMTQQFLIGAGAGGGVVAIAATVLYFTVLPHNK